MKLFSLIAAALLPWMTWVTIGIFSSQKVEAVQDNKYANIIEMLNEIKQEIKAIRK